MHAVILLSFIVFQFHVAGRVRYVLFRTKITDLLAVHFALRRTLEKKKVI